MEPALSVTISDCVVQTFRAGGPGGQNQNKRSTGVRVRHEPSGAVGESREFRTQLENKRAAFGRMARHPRMMFWIHRRLHGERFPPEVLAAMRSRPEEFQVEVREGTHWVELTD